ncbi:unnamed protein product [Cylindrotheca closterium]|uniref:Leucine-rich repeat domain-containing protein n=1 Tax=Cylindrotheca closterium TaxID=2856 RepID=A0AAD2CP37_9STRA|nr:unnamed protein product [Cylindrotheca closterium]
MADETNDTPFVYTVQPKNEIPRGINYVIVDPSVRIIHNNSFEECLNLCSLTLPKSLRVIGKRAFERCSSLEYVYIHDGLQVIGREAFRDCSSLIHIRFPAQGLTTIRKGVLDGCGLLQSLSIPSTVEKIGQNAFHDCISLKKVTLRDGIRSIGSGSFWKCESMKEFQFPETLESIEAEAFVWCKFQAISLPASVKTIGTKAFSGCAALTTVKLQEGLQYIGRYSFCSCDLLVDIDLPTGLTAIDNRAFLMCTSLRTISIPGTVERIGDGAFASCTSLTDVEIQNGVRAIGHESFIRCTQLSGIVLPLSLDEIGANAFFNCISLQGVEIPSKSKITIGKKCFAGCKNLINLSIPDATRFATEDAFSRCDLLQTFDAIWSIRERFEQFPVHNACYQASSKSIDHLTQALDDSCQSLKGYMEDPFGMTAFHIVATSPNPRIDFLDCVLDRYPLDALSHNDAHGKTMMYYMLKHTSNKVIPLIKIVVHRAVIERIAGWGAPESWRADLVRQVESIHGDDPMGRNNSVYNFFDHTRHYARVEMTSFLELALWKMRMRQGYKKETEKVESYREICRYQCGADVVVENVAGFLWNGQPKSYAGMAVFAPHSELSFWIPWF